MTPQGGGGVNPQPTEPPPSDIYPQTVDKGNAMWLDNDMNTTTQSGPLRPLHWERQSAGWYVAVGAYIEIFRVILDDGPWWIVRDLSDGSAGDPHPTLKAAMASVEAVRM
jgi:hypothetical protein